MYLLEVVHHFITILFKWRGRNCAFHWPKLRPLDLAQMSSPGCMTQGNLWELGNLGKNGWRVTGKAGSKKGSTHTFLLQESPKLKSSRPLEDEAKPPYKWQNSPDNGNQYTTKHEIITLRTKFVFIETLVLGDYVNYGVVVWKGIWGNSPAFLTLIRFSSKIVM